MTKIHAYCHRDYRNCFLPRDVLDAIGESSWVRQGKLYVFAGTVEAAWRRLNTMDLAPRSAKDLRRAHPSGSDVSSLTEAGLGTDGAVYAMSMNGWAVVSIRQDIPDRILDRIGEIKSGVYHGADHD